MAYRTAATGASLTTEDPEDQYVVYSHLSLSNKDAILASFLFFNLVFVTSAIVSHCLRTYCKFQPHQKVFWNLAVSRAVFGICSTCVATWYLQFIQWPIPCLETSPQSTTIIQTCVGFFLFECIILFGSNIKFRTFDPLLAIHHSMALASFSLCLLLGHAHTYVIMCLLFEISTPFTCVSWIFLKTGHADSKIWKLNQYAMVHAFHLRQALCYLFWFFLWRHWGDFMNIIHPALTGLYIAGVILQTFLMNPYWLHKKTMQLFNPADWNFIPKNELKNSTENRNEHPLGSTSTKGEIKKPHNYPENGFCREGPPIDYSQQATKKNKCL